MKIKNVSSFLKLCRFPDTLMSAYNIIRCTSNRVEFMKANQIKSMDSLGLTVPLRHKFDMKLRRGSESTDDRIDFYL